MNNTSTSTNKQIIEEYLTLRRTAWKYAKAIERLRDEWGQLQGIIDMYEKDRAGYTSLTSKIALSAWERILEIRTLLEGEIKKGCKHKRTGKGLKYENFKQFDKVQSFRNQTKHYKVLREYKVWESDNGSKVK